MVELLLDLMISTLTDEEVKAVQVLHRALEDMPQSYALLHVQSDFLRSKGGQVNQTFIHSIFPTILSVKL
jgi:hypothetical protein